MFGQNFTVQMPSMDVGRSGFAGKETMKCLSSGYIEQFTVCGDNVIILGHTTSLLRMPRPCNEVLAGNNDRTIVAIG